MKQSDDFIFCKNFINDFISKYLKGNIQALLDFDFASLRQDKQFGCNSRGFDWGGYVKHIPNGFRHLLNRTTLLHWH